MHFFFLSVPNMCNLNITFYISHFKGIETEVIKEKRGERKKMVKVSGKIGMAIAAILLISLIGTASAIRSIGRNPDAFLLRD